jgi:hypothetical protein
MPAANLNHNIKYAAFTLLYPVIGSYMYGRSLFRSPGASFWYLFPCLIMVAVSGLGFNFAWHHRTNENVAKYVQGNLLLFLVLACMSFGLSEYRHFLLK